VNGWVGTPPEKLPVATGPGPVLIEACPADDEGGGVDFSRVDIAPEKVTTVEEAPGGILTDDVIVVCEVSLNPVVVVVSVELGPGTGTVVVVFLNRGVVIGKVSFEPLIV